MITASIMLATIMQGVDNTIANVALPHIQGSLSAAQDQIAWVLTSYIVAVAIMTPLTGWLAGRLGIKYVFLISVAGFTLASALCGSATSLTQLVIYRLPWGPRLRGGGDLAWYRERLLRFAGFGLAGLIGSRRRQSATSATGNAAAYMNGWRRPHRERV